MRVRGCTDTGVCAPPSQRVSAAVGLSSQSGAGEHGHTPEYDGEVDLYGHVILCLAALHGHVEDDVLLAHQAVAFHPRHPAVAARRPHDFARGVVHDAAKARDERIAALWHLRTKRGRQRGLSVCSSGQRCLKAMCSSGTSTEFISAALQGCCGPCKVGGARSPPRTMGEGMSGLAAQSTVLSPSRISPTPPRCSRCPC